MTVKKLLSMLLVFVFVIGFLNVQQVFAADNKRTELPQIYVFVNDTLVEFPDVQPVVKSGRTYIPVRFYAEAMKLNVTYYGDSNTVVISNKEKWLLLHYNENYLVLADGTKVEMPMFLTEGRVMTPYRYIAEYFGYEVQYSPLGPIARAVNKEDALSLEEIYQEYQSVFEQHKAEYEAYLEELRKQEAEKRKQEEKNKNPIYLTFDDGPNSNTPKILDILQEYDAKATFFMIGGNISSNPSTVKRMIEEGHGVGLHSMTHDKDKFYKSPDSALSEMNQANERLHKVANIKTTLIRTPYGSKPYFTKEYRDATAKAGYHLWDWNVDSNDWKHQGNADAIYNDVMTQVKNLKKRGVTPVILFHDQKTTVQALPKILKVLKDEGYTFKAITDNTKPVNFWSDER